MKTAELMLKYKHEDLPEPTVRWERLVWMSARLLKMAEEERHTYRQMKSDHAESDNRQMSLFD